MLTHDEKRDFIRMDVDCDITYRPADGNEAKRGKCVSLSGAGVSFIGEDAFNVGLAMEVSILPKSSITPPMTAFIEVVRCDELEDKSYRISAVIRSIKSD